jgi:hypothetical protein
MTTELASVSAMAQERMRYLYTWMKDPSFLLAAEPGLRAVRLGFAHLDDGIRATKPVYEKGIRVGEEPDWKERRENAALIISYRG